MKSKRFSGGLLAGVIVTIGVLAVVGVLTLRVNAQYLSSSELDSKSSAELAGGAEFKLTGLVSSMGVDSLVVNGQTVKIDTGTSLDSSVAAGSMVEVEGKVVNGVMLADKVQLEDQSSLDKSTEELGSSSSDESSESFGSVSSDDSIESSESSSFDSSSSSSESIGSESSSSSLESENELESESSSSSDLSSSASEISMLFNWLGHA